MHLTREEQNILTHIQMCLALQVASTLEQQSTVTRCQTMEESAWHYCCVPQPVTREKPAVEGKLPASVS